MSSIFAFSKFNGDISKWDVSNVTNMTYMFYGSTFNKDISEWDVSNVTDMSFIFAFSNFDKDISKWDISNVTTMKAMFKYSKFKLDISNWFNKLNHSCNLYNFGIFNNIKINSYNDFIQYHREMILKKIIKL